MQMQMHEITPCLRVKQIKQGFTAANRQRTPSLLENVSQRSTKKEEREERHQQSLVKTIHRLNSTFRGRHAARLVPTAAAAVMNPL